MKEFTEADRPAILDLLKRRGPRNVPALASFLDVNRTAVRQQLAVLEREGLVQMRVEKQVIGRPTHVWSLTAKAEALFPQAYGPIALALLRHLREIDGEGKVEALLRRRARELAAAYRKRLEGKTLGGKFKELARIRDEEGYMAEGDIRELTEHHCPIAAIAKEFPQVCALEKKLFEAMLGIGLDRTEHLASGDTACVYRPR